MEAALARKIENGVGRAAAASLALACAYAAYAWLLAPLAQPASAAAAAAAAGIAFLCCDRLLSAVDSGRHHPPVRIFHVRDYVPDPLEELLLTDRYEAQEPASEPLILDDILAQLGPDSRVVRLFDAATMPTPAQLKSRIDAHLGHGDPETPAADASQALHDALAELRRSMR